MGDRIKNYKGREQSWVKHYVLENYLERLAFKVVLGRRKYKHCSDFTLTYIDGFSGPWKSYTDDFSDTSFQIAINKFRSVRDALIKQGINLHIRCLFVEKDPTSFALLQEHLSGINDISPELRNGEFEEYIDFAREFAISEGNSFTFTFIDPTGWTGFGLNKIKPILQLGHSEVLINFMTKDIIRFIDDSRPELGSTFQDLFGTNDLRSLFRNLKGREREEEIVKVYRQRIKEESGYEYVADAVVLNPKKDLPHYHLIYGTHSLDGLLTFRRVEEKAMKEQNSLRNVVKQEKEINRTGKLQLFSPEEVGSSGFFNSLRERYLSESKRAVENELKRGKWISYDRLLAFLEMPMTYESDIKDWLKQWRNSGLIRYHGLSESERVPKKGYKHRIEWLGEMV